jgi:hypothetical protein
MECSGTRPARGPHHSKAPVFDPFHELWAELPKLLRGQESVGSERANLSDGCRSPEVVEDRNDLLVALPHEPVDRQVPLVLGLVASELMRSISPSIRSQKRSSATSRSPLKILQSDAVMSRIDIDLEAPPASAIPLIAT